MFDMVQGVQKTNSTMPHLVGEGEASNSANLDDQPWPEDRGSQAFAEESRALSLLPGRTGSAE